MNNTAKAYLFFLFLSFLFPDNSRAQKVNNVWTFGSGLGIDFNGIAATTIKTDILANESCASICDPISGKLLFYTNGVNVWDSTNTIMPNGSGILGPVDRSSTQGVVIAPVFGHPTKFYIFTLEEFNLYRSGYFRFSVVDMSLNSGKGDVLPGLKNMNIDTGRSEKMILAPACNGLWVITHHIDSPIFYSYKIDNPLYIPRPVISNTGGKVAKDLYCIGEMKLSPDEKSIAMGNWISPVTGYSGNAPIELFDFDRITGKVSNGRQIDSSNYAYSIEFSPSNNRLYVALFDSFMYQYDISLLPSVSAVTASKTQLPGDNFSSLRRAPDKKIYINRHNYFKEISRINNPDLNVSSCGLEINVPSLAMTTSSAVYIQFGNNALQPVAGSDTLYTSQKSINYCNGDAFDYIGDIKHKDFLWQDGDTSHTRRFNAAGKFWISSTMGCARYVDTFDLSFKDKSYTYHRFSEEFCFKSEYIARPKNPGLNIWWQDSSTGPSYTFKSSGKTWVTTTNGDCHFNIDSFDIKLTDYKLALKDSFLCSNDTIVFDATIDSPAIYLWQDGSSTPQYKVYQPGDYWVNIQVGKCNLKEEVKVFQKSFAVNFGADTNICQGSEVRLEVMDKDLKYLWQDGSTLPYFDAKEKGTYSVKISDGNCSVTANAFVDVVTCENCIHIPNAFTPNGDGINDKFRILTECLIEKFELMIYNRWGEQVYFSNNYNAGWDGTYKAQVLNSAVFYYMLRVKFRKPGSEEEIYKGDISLIR